MAKINVSLAIADDILTAFNTRLNAGSGAGKCKIYTGTIPATPDTAITSQIKLAELVLSDPAATISGRTMTFGTVTQDGSAGATGTATWARFEDSSGTAVIDIDITTTGGGGTGTMPSTIVVAGTPVTAPSIVLTA